MTDLLIVGRGLAACVLMHTCRRYSLSFRVVGIEDLSVCSRVAAGIWNPVVFKRMTQSWMAPELVPFLTKFYASCGDGNGERYLTKRRIMRIFSEEQEQALWLKKSAAELKGWIDPQLYSADTLPSHLKAKNPFSYVEQAGNLDVAGFMDMTSTFFGDLIVREKFDYSLLKLTDGNVSYKSYEAKAVVFCEGVRVADNPFFNWIPLKPAKGEVLDIESKEPIIRKDILNRSVFVMPLENNRYRVGATYEWKELNEEPTSAGQKELTDKLKNITVQPFELRAHRAGIRPSSLDRRPIIGAHPAVKHLYVFNGLGTKGVMLAPFFANNFVLFYLQKQDLDPAVDCSRFYNFYGKQT